MKIAYFDSREPIDEDIISALKKLNHKVIPVNDLSFKDSVDLFLFRETVVSTNNLPIFFDGLIKLGSALATLKCKKALWFTNKVLGLGNDLLETIIPQTTAAFLNDETWIRRHGYKNVFPLHLGANDLPEGRYNKLYDADIVFNGVVYSAMASWLDDLKKIYGNRFQLFNVSGKEYADLCASAKIIIVSKFLLDDFYWTEQIYQTLALRGFIIHPRTYGLELKDGEHYISYNSFVELVDAINWFQKYAAYRDGIASEGRKEVLKNFTYKNRLKFLLSKI